MAISYIEQKIAGIDEPMLTVRPRYVKDQLDGLRGRRSRFRLISPNSAKNITPSGISQSIHKELLPSGKGFTSMLITDISYQFMERTQINETFGDSITVYAFGSAPVVLNISGVVVDDLDNNWFVKLIHVYKDFIRATALAKHFEIARLDMPDASYIGSVLSLNVSKNSANDALVPFSMQFLVRNYQFNSTQAYDQAAMEREKPIEDVAKDATSSYKTLKDVKNLEANLNAITSGNFDIAAGFTKEQVSGVTGRVMNGVTQSLTSPIGIDGSLAKKQVNKLSLRDVDKALASQYNRLKGSLDLDKILGMGLEKNISSSTQKVPQAYKLTVLGAYSSQLLEVGEDSAVSQFLKQRVQTTNKITDDAIAVILNEVEAQSAADKAQKKASLKNTIAISKKIMDLASGKRSLSMDSIGELGEIGKELKGTLGKVGALPTTAADRLGQIINNSPLANIPIVGSLLGGITADQSERYFRKKVPKETSVFLKIPSQEPQQQRILRVATEL